jgi:hypothetical protein
MPNGGLIKRVTYLVDYFDHNLFGISLVNALSWWLVTFWRHFGLWCFLEIPISESLSIRWVSLRIFCNGGILLRYRSLFAMKCIVELEIVEMFFLCMCDCSEISWNCVNLGAMYCYGTKYPFHLAVPTFRSSPPHDRHASKFCFGGHRLWNYQCKTVNLPVTAANLWGQVMCAVVVLSESVWRHVHLHFEHLECSLFCYCITPVICTQVFSINCFP